MMALVETHVQLSEGEREDKAPRSEDSEDSNEGSRDEGSEDDGGSEGEEDEDGGEEGNGENANAGWAEAMAKILGKKTSETKSSILLKNKELEAMKTKEREETLERKTQVDKKRAWEMMCRQKPDVVTDREAEKTLQRTATRGVVQLFNAVRKHQKTVEDKVKEAGGSERKKAKILSSVSKRDFIDVLRRTETGGRVPQHTDHDAAAPAEDQKPAWSVLRDDFMMGATMKDWDKDSDGEETGGGGEGQ